MRTVWVSCLALAAVTIVSCSDTSNGDGPDSASQPTTMYSSVDAVILREMHDDLRADTGLDVHVVGDTEASKTTGLVMRLLAEKDRPRADVWWSSEPFGTIKLVRAGVLAPAPDSVADDAFEGGWPANLRDPDRLWFAFATRARVFVHSTDRVPTPPTTLAELAEPTWSGRVGMARPAFGTTRGHMGALRHAWGKDAFERWLEAMEANGLRLYDGNATVVRAVHLGEIDVGLTDTDDVWAGQANGWAVDATYEAVDPDAGDGDWPSLGALVLPNTAGLVAGGPNPEGGVRLLDEILSARTESRLANTASRNAPVIPEARAQHPEIVFPNPWTPDLNAVADVVDEAAATAARVLE